jgi:hypothetical protein
VTEDLLPKLSKIFSLNFNQLEKEFYSEKIAEILYKGEDTKDLMKLAEEKAKYFRLKKQEQGILKL